MSSIQSNISTLHQEILNHSAGRDIRLIAVSKTVGVDPIKEAVEAGILDLGESRIQEAELKFTENPFPGVTRHFIGTIQSNKIRKLTMLFHWFHGLDSLAIAAKIAAEKSSLKCLIQVNTSGEPSKSGLHPDELLPFVRAAREIRNLSIRGLMTIGPNTREPKLIRQAFELLRKLQRDCLPLETESVVFNELSMGMSSDYLIAIKSGATMLRIGTRIFGERL